MIARDEIEAKGLESGIHVADVQRDYVLRHREQPSIRFCETFAMIEGDGRA
jgi:hypothetical protein